MTSPSVPTENPTIAVRLVLLSVNGVVIAMTTAAISANMTM